MIIIKEEHMSTLKIIMDDSLVLQYVRYHLKVTTIKYIGELILNNNLY